MLVVILCLLLIEISSNLTMCWFKSVASCRVTAMSHSPQKVTRNHPWGELRLTLMAVALVWYLNVEAEPKYHALKISAENKSLDCHPKWLLGLRDTRVCLKELEQDLPGFQWLPSPRQCRQPTLDLINFIVVYLNITTEQSCASECNRGR